LVDRKIEQWGFTKGKDIHLNITVKNVADAGNLSGAIFTGILCGATLYIIPGIAVDKYRMTVVISEDGKESITREYNSSITTYTQIAFIFWGLFAYPIETAKYKCIEDMLDHCMNDLVGQGVTSKEISPKETEEAQPKKEKVTPQREEVTGKPKTSSTGWSSELSKEIAAFSGKWKGTWSGGGTFFTLIVTEIDSEKAKIIYDQWEGNLSPALHFDEIAKVIPGESPKIQFNRLFRFKGGQAGSVGWFTFEMQKDLKTLKGVAQWPKDTLKTTMEKIE